MNKEIGSHISISDADVSAFYEANKSGPAFNLAENKVQLAQILVTPTAGNPPGNLKNDKAQNDTQARNKIEGLAMRVRQGEDFGGIAQTYSEDPNWAPNGGDMGFVPESALNQANPELRKVVLGMTPARFHR